MKRRKRNVINLRPLSPSPLIPEQEQIHLSRAMPHAFTISMPPMSTKIALIPSAMLYATAVAEWKEKLNLAKSRLCFVNESKWRELLALVCIDSAVPALLRHHRIPLATRAWLKMFQLLETCSLKQTLPYVSNSSLNNAFSSFHLCEAPGAFISALKYFIERCNPKLRHWYRATSLASDEPNMQLYHHHQEQGQQQNQKQKWWVYGQNGTGNILDASVISDLWNEAKATNNTCDLVTGDGGIDCSDNPAAQEEDSFALIFAQTVAALGLLRHGGTFILKIFTAHEWPTACVLHLIRQHFREMKVSKPFSSKPTNSECYVIAEDFQGIDPSLLQTLLLSIGCWPCYENQKPITYIQLMDRPNTKYVSLPIWAGIAAGWLAMELETKGDGEEKKGEEKKGEEKQAEEEEKAEEKKPNEEEKKKNGEEDMKFMRELTSAQVRLTRNQIQHLDTLLNWFFFVPCSSEVQVQVQRPSLSFPGIYCKSKLETQQEKNELTLWRRDFASWYLEKFVMF